MIMKKLLVVTIGLVILNGCGSTPAVKESKNMARLGVNFNLKAKSGCTTISPAIQVNNIPKNTHILKFEMTDLDYTQYNHGGGEVIYSGNNNIPAGALKSYDGPCPGIHGPHNYEIVVKAYSKDKSSLLGIGKSTKRYPPK